jgi:hypothetical protein
VPECGKCFIPTDVQKSIQTMGYFDQLVFVWSSSEPTTINMKSSGTQSHALICVHILFSVCIYFSQRMSACLDVNQYQQQEYSTQRILMNVYSPSVRERYYLSIALSSCLLPSSCLSLSSSRTFCSLCVNVLVVLVWSILTKD